MVNLMEGALQAMGIALAVAENPAMPLRVYNFLSRLMNFATEDVYHTKIAQFSTLLAVGKGFTLFN